MLSTVLKIPPCPDAVSHYLKRKMLEAPRGRDGEFRSQFMRELIDRFDWDGHGQPIPNEIVFYRWAMAVCKKGLGVEKKKSPSRLVIDDKVRERVKSEVSAYVNGQPQDSFIGSEAFDYIHDTYFHDLDWTDYASIIINWRKTVKSKAKGCIYCYQPYPKTHPNHVKIGWTADKKNPYGRMLAQTNTRIEAPEGVCYFFGEKQDEGIALKELSAYKVRDGGQEMRDLRDMDGWAALVSLFKDHHANWPPDSRYANLC